MSGMTFSDVVNRVFPSRARARSLCAPTIESILVCAMKDNYPLIWLARFITVEAPLVLWRLENRPVYGQMQARSLCLVSFLKPLSTG